MAESPEILHTIAVACVWLVLVSTAWIDGRTGRVPDKYLLVGFVAALAACILASLHNPSGTPLTFILTPLAAALAFGAFIWGVNELWFRWRKQDALGMGDAKWSVVAALACGIVPVLWAWALAAWLGLAWLGLSRWRGAARPHLHFTPFLCAALLLVQLLLKP